MLNNNQLIAVQLVAQGKTGKFISEHLNVAQETISRWRKKPEFIASVNVMLNQLRDSTQQKMRNISILEQGFQIGGVISWEFNIVCKQTHISI